MTSKPYPYHQTSCRQRPPGLQDSPPQNREPEYHSDELKGQIRNFQRDDAVVAKDFEPEGPPVIAPGIVGLEVPHRHFAQRGVYRPIPKESFVGDVQSEATPKQKGNGDEYGRDQDGIKRKIAPSIGTPIHESANLSSRKVLCNQDWSFSAR